METSGASGSGYAPLNFGQTEPTTPTVPVQYSYGLEISREHTLSPTVHQDRLVHDNWVVNNQRYEQWLPAVVADVGEEPDRPSVVTDNRRRWSLAAADAAASRPLPAEVELLR